MPTGSSGFNLNDERAHRLERAIDEFRTALDEGRRIDDDAFCRTHADLMPELGIQIRMLRRIRGVDVDSDENLPDRSDYRFDDGDIRRFLQANLPQYSIEDGISRGGQGLVFRAIHLHTHRPVAIKVLADGVFATRQQLDRFMREIELAARLRHPNIVAIHDSGTIQNRPYCVMEFVDGTAIDDYVLLERPGLAERIQLFVKICRALSYAHQRGVIHRDLKPANILVDADGEPRLLDFGLAKDAFATEATGAGLSMPGQVIGTLQYLSPEQFRGEPGEIDIRTDLYALGLVFYHVLTGAFPYPVEGSYDAVRDNILSRNPVSIRGLSKSPETGIDLHEIDADIEAILRKALEKEKDRRYQSASEMADDFDRYLRGDVVEARADTRFYVLRKTLRRYRIQLAVASGFVLMATIAAIISTTLYVQAARERDRANESASLAQRIMNRVFTVVDDVVSRLAGGQRARDLIYQGSDDDLAQLADVLGNIEGVDCEQARVNINRGKIAVRSGDIQEAVSRFRQAIAGLDATQASDAQTAALKIEAMTLLGSVLENPRASLSSAIELAKAHLASGADGELFSVLLCEAQVEMSRQASLAGDKAIAVKWADEALATFKASNDDSPYHARLMQAAVSAHDWAGGAERNLGDCEASEAHFKSALQLLGQLIAASPADFSTRYKRMRLYTQVANYAKDAGELDRAVHFLKLAIDDAELLCGADPGEYEWSRGLIVANLGLALIQREDAPDQAQATLQKCEKRLADWQAMFPSNARYREISGAILDSRGLIAQSDKQWAKSLDYFNEALSVFQALEADGFGHLNTRDSIAFVLSRLGKAHRQVGDYEKALRCSGRCLAIRWRQLAMEPQSTTRRLDYLEARFDWDKLILNIGDPIVCVVAHRELEMLEAELGNMESDDSNRCQIRGIEKSLLGVRGELAESRWERTAAPFICWIE